MHPRDPDDIGLGSTWARHQVGWTVFARVSKALAENGISVLPVKGLVTARLLYESEGERPLPDIDLRISPTHRKAVLALAKSRGWSARVDSPRMQDVLLDVGGWEVDIETTFGPPGLCALTVEQAIARATSAAEPIEHLEPEIHDHALILALNAFKDGLRPPPWAIEDLLRIGSRVEARVLVERARVGKVSTALWLVAEWLSEDGGSVAWRRIRNALGARPPSSRVAAAYRRVVAEGWPGRAGLLVTATSSDSSGTAVKGLALALAGVARRRLLIALSRL